MTAAGTEAPAESVVPGLRFDPSLLAMIVLIPATALALWFLLDVSRVLPEPDAAIAVERGDVSLTREGHAAMAVELPHDWRRAFPHDEAFYHFPLHLEVPPHRLWAMLLPDVDHGLEIYLNGHIIGSSPRLDTFAARAVVRPLYVVLPDGLLRSGTNDFTFRATSGLPGHGVMPTFYLGPDETLSPIFARRHFVQVQLVWLFGAGSLGMALGIAVLAVLRRHDTVYAWLAAVTAFWSVLTLLSLTPLPAFPGTSVSVLYTVSSTGFCASAFLFGLRFAGLERPLLERVIFALAAGGIVLVVLVALVAPDLTHRVAPLGPAAQMVIGPFVLALLLMKHLREPDPELFLLLYAGGVVVVFGTFSWLASLGMASNAHAQYLFYVTPLILAVVVTLLIRRFVAALDQSEQLATSLAAQVDAKSRELEDNYRRLADMEKRQALIEERERIMRDMHDGVGGHIVSSLSRVRALELPDPHLGETLQSALTDLRLMVDSLESVEGDLGLALGMLRNRLQPQIDAAGLRTVWRVEALPACDAFSSETVLQILRILQEAITNVIRHAEADEVELSARVQGADVICSVRDDGVGLPDEGPINAGRGLHNMRQRAERIGAELTITAASPGTRVELRLSL